MVVEQKLPTFLYCLVGQTPGSTRIYKKYFEMMEQKNDCEGVIQDITTFLTLILIVLGPDQSG